MTNTSCFYGDGSLANDWAYVPCHDNKPDFAYSTCCIPNVGDRCLGNGLCDYTSGNYLYRPPCADDDGRGCPSICPDGSSLGLLIGLG